MIGVFYDRDSDEIVSMLHSRTMAVDLGVIPNLENQNIARMVLRSCHPKLMHGFEEELARRQRRLGPTAVLLPPFVIKRSDFSKVVISSKVLDLVRKGLIHDPQL
jgi:hypothetical protein